jgi:hypothetical protein
VRRVERTPDEGVKGTIALASAMEERTFFRGY